ncbi:FCD domain-containing protein [Streptomyces chattanoogensis]|uniref:FCD domain-containing protein n=1 Tax=Streptomyces chattanoogensis TaxID=66876 RepID=UPI0005D96D8C|nr:hypothetical protein T261_5893 [Streptomyces lydicus]
MTYRHHLAIYEALKAGDGERAVTAMHRHFDGLRNRLANQPGPRRRVVHRDFTRCQAPLCRHEIGRCRVP